MYCSWFFLGWQVRSALKNRPTTSSVFYQLLSNHKHGIVKTHIQLSRSVRKKVTTRQAYNSLFTCVHQRHANMITPCTAMEWRRVLCFGGDDEFSVLGLVRVRRRVRRRAQIMILGWILVCSWFDDEFDNEIRFLNNVSHKLNSSSNLSSNLSQISSLNLSSVELVVELVVVWKTYFFWYETETQNRELVVAVSVMVSSNSSSNSSSNVSSA